jgi:hypothetical protein
MNFDRTCTYKCPSCRVDLIVEDSKGIKRIEKTIEETIEDMMEEEFNETNLLYEIEENMNRLNYDIDIQLDNYTIKDLGKIRHPFLLNKILAACACRKKKVFEMEHSIQSIYEKDIFENKSNFIKKIKNDTYIINMKKNIIKKINELTKCNKKVYGIIPYKLFDIQTNIIHRDEKFLTDNVIEKINKVVEIIKICENKNKEEQLRIINDFIKTL